MGCSILVQTASPGDFAAFTGTFERRGCAVSTVATPEACLEAVRHKAPTLVVLDAGSLKATKQAVLGIMRANALVYTAVVTDMPEEVFHDAMEGLGILASLPAAPSAAEAERLLGLLAQLSAYVSA